MMGRRQLSLRLARRARTRAFLPFLEQVEDRLVLSTFVVTNTNDSGSGSLRQAILDSNATDLAATGGTSEIDFNIPASTAPNLDVPVPGFDPVNQTWTITLDSPLPTITSTVMIDGYSQAESPVPFRYPSASYLAVQELSVLGSPTGGTFTLTSFIPGHTGPTVPIPYNADAATVQAALETVVGSRNATVTGGPAPGNPMTIYFTGQLAGQIIGPLTADSSGLSGGESPAAIIEVLAGGGLPIGNPQFIQSTSNTVAARAGNDAHDRVIIDGSSTGGGIGFNIDASQSVVRGLIIDGFGVGVSVPNPTDVGDRIQGDYIGKYLVFPVNLTNGEALASPDNVALTGHGNSLQGVILNSNNTIVGGVYPQENNVISGDGLQGVLIQSAGTGNAVEGNQIGIISTPSGLYYQVGNGAEGVLVYGSSNQIGGIKPSSIGTSPDAGNVISGNGSHGVRISGSGATRDIVAGNLIGVAPGGGYKFGSGNPGNGDAGDGIRIEDSAQNQIGGPTADWGNTISSNFGAGVYITGATSVGNSIANNLIGVTYGGLAAKGNAQDGVADFSPGTVIGPGNLISGNLRGVLISGPSATGVVVRDNLIGTDISGVYDLGNAEEGVLIDNASGNTVTGNANGSQVISGNNVGVAITSSSSTLPPSSLNLVAGNLIGSDKSGLNPLPNAQEGVLIDSANRNTIGGTTAAARNLISANNTGVLITGSSASSNVVQGNYIGTDITGQAPLANETDGVVINMNASGNLIGGSSTAAGNVIAFNLGDGVLVDTGIFNSILTNSIFSNGGKGIDLLDDGNHNQPAPVLTSIQSVVSGTAILGTVRGTPSTPYTIQFFSNAVSGPEGKTFLGQVSVTTGAS
ncbi:MAG: beta strand repeat-containing protein, partial [Isosphaeraceae bacterium]